MSDLASDSIEDDVREVREWIDVASRIQIDPRFPIRIMSSIIE